MTNIYYIHELDTESKTSLSATKKVLIVAVILVIITTFAIIFASYKTGSAFQVDNATTSSTTATYSNLLTTNTGNSSTSSNATSHSTNSSTGNPVDDSSTTMNTMADISTGSNTSGSTAMSNGGTGNTNTGSPTSNTGGETPAPAHTHSYTIPTYGAQPWVVTQPAVPAQTIPEQGYWQNWWNVAGNLFYDLDEAMFYSRSFGDIAVSSGSDWIITQQAQTIPGIPEQGYYGDVPIIGYQCSCGATR